MTTGRLVLVFAIFVLACAGCGKRFDPDLEPSFLQFTDDAAKSAGIGLLRDKPIAAGTTEIRIWTGFGVQAPEEMVRLRIDAAGTVEGDLLLRFRPVDLTDDEAARGAFLQDVMRHCRDLREPLWRRRDSVCTATFRREPDWRALYAQLRQLGVETLPDESDLATPPPMVLDGISMVVEVRKGADYRAYEYGNPSYNEAPEGRKADEILETVSRLARQSDGRAYERSPH